MVDIHIHDDVLNNILTRLPGKSLLRFRCVSKHWNRLISDPSFMKSRSRRMILLKHPMPFIVLDTKDHSIINIPNSLLEEKECKEVYIVGTQTGIVVLAITDFSLRTHMYLYNPLTRASKLLDVMDRPCPERSSSYEFGFGYGATSDKNDDGFELWVKKEDENNSWSKERSFTFGLDSNYFKKFHPVCILVDGRILLTDGYNQFVICDTTKDSYVTISHNLINPDFDIRLITLSDFKRIRSVEYVESLVSPSDLCAL
ncbi:F-box protein CPR1-like [Rutidosis leptorrhynchoides]|uniref:F-box protein CPR1-like n=1 Tax=Rutidosis leptorrhynchoides TaxID=125765 RepID=UPI003A99721F